jgi:hypothetical protein
MGGGVALVLDAGRRLYSIFSAELVDRRGVWAQLEH